MKDRIGHLAQFLVDQGLRHVFGIAGSGLSLRLISELEDRQARYFPSSHEATAALMAGAVCRAGGILSASIGIKGPGVANMLPGIVANRFECHPALSITEAFGLGTPKHRQHKRLDHPALLSSVTKAIGHLSNRSRKWEALLKLARREVPGPVHLELSRGDSEFKANEMPRHQQSPAPQGSGERTLDLINRAKQPIVVIGSLGLRREWSRHFNQLRIPVFTTVAAKGVVDETGPCSAGIFSGAGRELAPEARLLPQADLVVAFGLRNTEVLNACPFLAPLVAFDEIDEGLSLGFEPQHLELEAGDGLVLRAIEILKTRVWGLEPVREEMLPMHRFFSKAGWLPSACFQILDGLGCPHALVLDTGSFCTIGEHLWRAGPQRLFMGSSVGRNMGTAIPTAIGASLACPGLPVFCIVGDGGMHLYCAEIKLAVREDLPVCFVLMSDGRYGSVACVGQDRPMTARATEMFQPTWIGVVQEFGCPANRVESEEEFAAALERWDFGHPFFIEAAFDAGKYARMTESLR